MVHVYTVLWGDKYSTEYVYRMKRMVSKNLEQEHQFFCLTSEILDGINTINPLCDYPGWWQKIGLFHPEIGAELNIYIDLDSVVVGQLDSIVTTHLSSDIAMPREWHPSWKPGWQSSFIIWKGRSPIAVRIWNEFDSSVMGRLEGDQDWMTELLGNEVTEIKKGEIVSYKFHCRSRWGVPTGAKVVTFHGKPDPHEVDKSWIKRAWEENS